MQELSVNLLCVYTRQGIEIWIEKERAENFVALLKSPNAPQFIEIAGTGNLVNRADITGIFTASSMEEMKRRKNGQWTCKFGVWHEKFQDCACRPTTEEPIPYGDLPPLSDEDRERNAAAIAKVRAGLGKGMKN